MKLWKLFKSDEIQKIEFNPGEFDSVQKIANHLLNGGEAIVNLNKLTREEARRTTDFLSGLIYAMGGRAEKLGKLRYQFFPN